MRIQAISKTLIYCLNFRVYLKEELFKKTLLKFCTKSAEEVFSKGKYNPELFQYALKKVFDNMKSNSNTNRNSTGDFLSWLFDVKDFKVGIFCLIFALAFGLFSIFMHKNYKTIN